MASLCDQKAKKKEKKVVAKKCLLCGNVRDVVSGGVGWGPCKNLHTGLEGGGQRDD